MRVLVNMLVQLQRSNTQPCSLALCEGLYPSLFTMNSTPGSPHLVDVFLEIYVI